MRRGSALRRRAGTYDLANANDPGGTPDLASAHDLTGIHDVACIDHIAGTHHVAGPDELAAAGELTGAGQLARPGMPGMPRTGANRFRGWQRARSGRAVTSHSVPPYGVDQYRAGVSRGMHPGKVEVVHNSTRC